MRRVKLETRARRSNLTKSKSTSRARSFHISFRSAALAKPYYTRKGTSMLDHYAAVITHDIEIIHFGWWECHSAGHASMSIGKTDERAEKCLSLRK